MSTKKMSLASLEGKLSRSAMKNIVAGGDELATTCKTSCSKKVGATIYAGHCSPSGSLCSCSVEGGSSCYSTPDLV